MRVLALVSADFGELSYAKYFLSGLATAPASAPTLLVPASLGQPEGPEAGAIQRNYADLAGILAAVEEIRPQIVLFFSAYLLTIGPRFSMFNTLWLVHVLRRRGIPMLTSDPFIGLLHTPWALQFDAVLPSHAGFYASLHARLAHWRMSLRGYLTHLRLRQVWHIYPAPMAHLAVQGPRRQCAFYNPPAVPTQAEGPSGGLPAPLWLFVLSAIDLQYQLKLHGQSFFVQVAARLQDAVHSGTNVLVLAPPEMLQRLRSLLPAGAPVELRDRCQHADYLRLLQQAQHLFLWNYYSFSVLHRVLNQQAVFFFAEGHMVSILPALQDEGIRAFYGGWRPPLLPIAEPLAPEALEQLGRQTCHHFANMKAHMAQGISAQAVLDLASGTGERTQHK